MDKPIVVVLDFETYYETGPKAFSLRTLTVHEYVNDPRFAIHCAGVAVGDAPPAVLTKDALDKIIPTIPWDNAVLVGHNLRFDGYILARHYGVKPRRYIDTMGLARALIGGRLKRHDLDSVAKYLGVPGKHGGGAALRAAAGKYWDEMHDDVKRDLVRYARQDVEITRQIFLRLWPSFPEEERELLDWTVRAACWPRIMLDAKPLKEEFADELAIRRFMVKRAGVDRSVLMSNDKFAQALMSLGVEPPRKVSPTTGKMTWAFDKKSEDFLALLQHEDERVRNLVEARLTVKTTIKETRAAKMLRMAEMGLPVPMPLQFSGAVQTHRFSGGDGMNPQNFPKASRRIENGKVVKVKPGRIRKAMTGGAGNKVVVVDSSNIELRVAHWLAGNEPLLDVIRAGGDPYCVFASKIYGEEVNPKAFPEDDPEHARHAEMRTIGKIALLGLQYGMGANKFADTVWNWTGIVIEPDMAQRIVDTYRRENIRIKQLWQVLDYQFKAVAQGQQQPNPAQVGFPNLGAFQYFVDLNERSYYIQLPGGLWLQYPKLRLTEDEELQFYCPRKANDSGYIYLYGGKGLENCTQALASAIIRQQMRVIMRRFGDELGEPPEAVTLQVHDEVVAVVPATKAERALQIMIEEMSRTPDWAPGLPLGAEGSIADSYGEAK
jgi:DNA polymerase